MSKTHRIIIKYSYTENTQVVSVDDTQKKWLSNRWCRPKKLTPYIKEGVQPGKYQPYSCNHNYRNTGNGARTGARNANRSLRKQVRQSWKRQLQREGII